MKTSDEIKDIIMENAQNVFNELAKPLIIKEMKRLKIKSIIQIMGVDFITLNNGKEYSDTDFCESSESRNNFYNKFIFVWHESPFYQLIDTDIQIN